MCVWMYSPSQSSIFKSGIKIGPPHKLLICSAIRRRVAARPHRPWLVRHDPLWTQMARIWTRLRQFITCTALCLFMSLRSEFARTCWTNCYCLHVQTVIITPYYLPIPCLITFLSFLKGLHFQSLAIFWSVSTMVRCWMIVLGVICNFISYWWFPRSVKLFRHWWVIGVCYCFAFDFAQVYSIKAILELIGRPLSRILRRLLF